MSLSFKTSRTLATLLARMGNSDLVKGERTPHGAQTVSAVLRQLVTEDLIFLPTMEVLHSKFHETIAQLRTQLNSRSVENA